MQQDTDEYTFEEQYDNIDNVDDPEREDIVFGERIDWDEHGTGGIIRFSAGDYTAHDPITPETVLRLYEKGFIDLSQRFNASPTILKMVEGACAVNRVAPETGECRLIGYVVSPERADCRITIEGAYYSGPVTDKVSEVFKDWFGTGYEFSESDSHLRRWHD